MEEYLQCLSIVKRRWLPVSVVFLTVLGLSILKTVLEPPIYQAQGQLLLKKNSAASSLTGEQAAQLIGGESNQLETDASILRSIPLAQKTISTLNLKIKPKVFLKELGVKILEGTNILEVYYASPDPKEAAAVVNTLMKVYIQSDIKASRAQTRSAREFIAEQIPLKQAKLQKDERRLQYFKQQNAALDLNAEASAIVKNIEDLKKDLAETRSNLFLLNRRIESIQKIFGVSSFDATITTLIGESPVTTSALEKLREVQEKIKVTGLQLTDNHPTMINLREQEETLRQQLEERIKESFVGQAKRFYKNVNPQDIVQLQNGGLQQDLLRQYANSQAEKFNLQLRLKFLTDTIEYYQKRALVLPKLQLQQSQIEREMTVTATSYQNLLSRYQELEVSENLQTSDARVMSPALLPEEALKSRQTLSLIEGLLGGIILAAGTAYILERLNKTVKTPKSAQELLGYDLLGYIPSFPDESVIPEVIVKSQPNSSISEAFRMVQTNLRVFNAEQSIKVIVVSSSVQSEGKSTVAANLAFSISTLGGRVLLTDADLRNPSQQKIWQLPNEIGLSNFLQNQLGLERIVNEVAPNLDVITAGGMNGNPSAMLNSSQMAIFVAQVAQKYDFVIIDTPPITVAADATVLGKLVNGIVFVVRPGVAQSNSIFLSKEMMEKANQNVLGIVMNGTSAYGKYHYYNYNYSAKSS